MGLNAKMPVPYYFMKVVKMSISGMEVLSSMEKKPEGKTLKVNVMYLITGSQ